MASDGYIEPPWLLPSFKFDKVYLEKISSSYP